MNWEAIGSILGSIAAIFAGIRWLLAVYFKQQTRLDIARKHAFTAQAELLKQETESLKSQIRFHKASLEQFSSEANKMMTEYKDGREATDKVYMAFGNFIMEARRRFETIENKKPETGKVIHDPPDEIEMKDNFGKVKVKG